MAAVETESEALPLTPRTPNLAAPDVPVRPQQGPLAPPLGGGFPREASGAASLVASGTTLRQVERVVAPSFLALALLLTGFVVFVLFLSGLPAGRAQAGLERRFERPLVDGRAPVGGVIPNGTPVARLDIPSIGVHQIVVEGTAPAQLVDGPGHLPVTPLPGQVGNSVIAAHRVAFGGPFSRLGDLRTGATIDVLTGQGDATYLVTGKEEVPASDVAPFQATASNRLTLVTADNVGSSRRLIVTAGLQGKPKPFPPGRPRVLSAADGGLVGGSTNVPDLELWLLALVGVAAASVCVYRCLPRPSGYLVTTPVILLTAWMVYSHLATLLPATL